MLWMRPFLSFLLQNGTALQNRERVTSWLDNLCRLGKGNKTSFLSCEYLALNILPINVFPQIQVNA